MIGALLSLRKSLNFISNLAHFSRDKTPTRIWIIHQGKRKEKHLDLLTLTFLSYSRHSFISILTFLRYFGNLVKVFCYLFFSMKRKPFWDFLLHLFWCFFSLSEGKKVLWFLRWPWSDENFLFLDQNSLKLTDNNPWGSFLSALSIFVLFHATLTLFSVCVYATTNAMRDGNQLGTHGRLFVLDLLAWKRKKTNFNFVSQ